MWPIWVYHITDHTNLKENTYCAIVVLHKNIWFHSSLCAELPVVHTSVAGVYSISANPFQFGNCFLLTLFLLSLTFSLVFVKPCSPFTCSTLPSLLLHLFTACLFYILVVFLIEPRVFYSWAHLSTTADNRHSPKCNCEKLYFSRGSNIAHIIYKLKNLLITYHVNEISYLIWVKLWLVI